MKNFMRNGITLGTPIRSVLKGLAVGALLVSGVAQSSAATFVGDRTDFRDETIYFAMTTRFYDGDPKNNVCSWDKQDVQISKNDPDWRGDFKGLIDKLDYIKALGFTAIWITPIVQNASGEDYHGYHAMDMSSVDLRYESRKEWGSEKDVKFQDLIDAAHAKGMKIILDVVLQHTGNFGEVNLNPLFTRDQNIKNQASVSDCLIPNPDRFGSDYFDQDPKVQYEQRFKYFKNPEFDNHNYYHHYGTGWNWDFPNRWWGQIAGDCVDLNTENNTVAEYVVNCYGKFIEMGVDGFRIDTSGHISPLTFNKQFIPQFHKIAEKYKSKRLNECEFFMFGEVCQRFQGSVVYRDHPNLSSYFYTWKSDQALLDEFDGSQAYWDTQILPEGHDNPVGPMAVCEKDTQDKARSNNAWLQNGRWHEPDYSQASGFNVIDFPVHYSFGSVGSVMGLFSQDNYYNDATYNVVYVDSHDYSPGPNDQMRFNGGTDQWAENLAFMFTFRGIPCIYYGSEVEFKAGKPIDVGGDSNKTPRSESGRAYFGNYLEGSVSASDFGEFTASGNVSKTLDADLAQHIIRLNKIRAAVPALRKGQYTFDGCDANGGWAFKRAWKDSYACVSVNGGGSFSNLPAGKYTELITGETFTVAEGGSLTLNAPNNKGQLRVAVKDWKGGKVGTDGKFIYATSAVAHGGSVEFPDNGTTEYYTKEDAPGQAKVTFNPAGGSFKTETLTVTATLNEAASTGWYQVGNGAKQTLTKGKSANFTVGEGMSYGETVTVTWGADNRTGKTSYKKVDPNAVITVYVTGPDGTVNSISGTNMYSWTASTTNLTGTWSGNALTETVEVDGKTFYYHTFDGSEPVNVIFSRNGAQTGDIEGIDADTYFEYNGSNSAKKIDVVVGPKAPEVRANPASGTKFNDNITVTLTVSPETDIYYTLNGQEASASSTRYTGPITLTETTTINTYAKNEVGEKRQSFTYTKVDGPVMDEMVCYFDNSSSNWNTVYAYCWDDNHVEANSFSGAWPGKALTETVTHGGKVYNVFRFTPDAALSGCMIIFNPGSDNGKTGNLVFENNAIYTKDGKAGVLSAVNNIEAVSALKVFVENGCLGIYSDNACTVDAVRIDGTVRRLAVEGGYNYYELPAGFYIVAGKKVVVR